MGEEHIVRVIFLENFYFLHLDFYRFYLVRLKWSLNPLGTSRVQVWGSQMYIYLCVQNQGNQHTFWQIKQYSQHLLSNIRFLYKSANQDYLETQEGRKEDWSGIQIRRRRKEEEKEVSGGNRHASHSDRRQKNFKNREQVKGSDRRTQGSDRRASRI